MVAPGHGITVGSHSVIEGKAVAALAAPAGVVAPPEAETVRAAVALPVRKAHSARAVAALPVRKVHSARAAVALVELQGYAAPRGSGSFCD